MFQIVKKYLPKSNHRNCLQDHELQQLTKTKNNPEDQKEGLPQKVTLPLLQTPQS
jgi:hypothetical protein